MRLSRTDLVHKTYIDICKEFKLLDEDTLKKQSFSSHTREYISLVNSGHLSYNLINFINKTIDKMVANNIIEQDDDDSFQTDVLRCQIFSCGDSHWLSISKNQQYEILQENSLKQLLPDGDTILTPSVHLALNGFDYYDRIDDFRDYSIPRGRWSDEEGFTKLEIQYFKYYVVIIEYIETHDNHGPIIVVDKENFSKNPDPYFYLWRQFFSYSSHRPSKFIDISDYVTGRLREGAQCWEPLDGVVQDVLWLFRSKYSEHYYDYEVRNAYKTIEDIEEFKIGYAQYTLYAREKNVKKIDLIHKFFFDYFRKKEMIKFAQEVLGVEYDPGLNDLQWLFNFVKNSCESISLLDKEIRGRRTFSGGFSPDDDCFLPLVDDGQYE